MMLRYALALSLLLVPKVALADTYVAFDLSGAYRFGPYDWRPPPLTGDVVPPGAPGSIPGPGAMIHVAIGGLLAERFSLAGELGFGQFFVYRDLEKRYAGPVGHRMARLGLRAEKLLTEHIFLRGAVGYEFLVFREGGLDVERGEWEPELTRGPWASISGGAHINHIGGVARIDAGRFTSEHATFFPITFSLGVDLAWQ